MDLKFETEATFLNDDKSWLRRREGIDDAESITLDLSLFTKATHFPNGFIPSGMTLGKVAATGLYGPYNNALGGGTADQGVFRGHLLSAVEVRPTNETGKAGAALFWRGTVRESRLPTNHGLDAAAKVDAGPTSAITVGNAPIIRYE
jgi:hypothetical protein